MARKKTSAAVILSARLNPVTSQYDRKALEIVKHQETKGFNFKQVAVDAILRSEGYTPEMFERDTSVSKLFAHLETMLADFSSQLMESLKNRGVSSIDDDLHSEGGISKFSQTFARGYLQRQQQALGDDEE